MKIRPVGRRDTHADGRTDGQTDRQTDRQAGRQTDREEERKRGMPELIVVFRNFPIAPKTCLFSCDL
jgi:hypothetical protein